MRSFLAGGLLLAALTAVAQIDIQDQKLFPQPDRQIPTPDSLLGQPLTSRHIRSHEIAEYFRLVSEKTDRVQFATYGRSHEGRPLVYAVVSDPANLRNLENIQKQQNRLFTQPETLTPQDLAKMPAVVWMGYGVHGDEASGPEAAVLTLYRLAASNDPATREILKNTVVFLLPDYNPDGRDRFTNWVNAKRGRTVTEHPADVEHNIPWPGGRTNHYWFDLNRDWLPLTQPESTGRHALYTAWRPQLTLDWHEMGANSTYFFQPGVPTRTNRNTPAENQAITGEIAAFYAKALENRNQLYFTEERFDDFYIGKGSTYPDVTGSVGILFEQAGSEGHLIQTPSRLLDYRTTVLNQYATSLATLEAAREKRQQLLDYQRRFFAEPYTGQAQALEIPLDPAPARVAALGLLLENHGVQTQKVSRGEQTFLRVPYNQRLWRFIKAAFDKPTTFDDDQFYDISAWSLDFAIGVPATEVNTLSGTVAPQTNWSDYAKSLGQAPAAHPAYAGFIVRGDHDHLFTLLARLQEENYQPHLVTREFPGYARPGDVFIPVNDPAQASPLHRLLTQAAQNEGIAATSIPAATGQVLSFGGGGTSLIRPVTIGLVTGSGNSNDIGELWHLMDNNWNLKVHLLDADRLASSDLSRLSHIVLAGSVPASARTALTEWLSAGGTLVATTGGVTTAAAAANWELQTKSYSPDLADVPYGDLTEIRTRHSLPGSIFQAEFDLTHPLAFNLPKTLTVFREGTAFITPPNQPGTVVGRYAANPLLAGYVSKEVLANAPGAACVLARSTGRGKVILIVDNVHFRAFFTGPNRLLGNALFFSGAF